MPMIIRGAEHVACTSWQGLAGPDRGAGAHHRGGRNRARGGRAPSSRARSRSSARGGALERACSGHPGAAAGSKRAL